MQSMTSIRMDKVGEARALADWFRNAIDVVFVFGEGEGDAIDKPLRDLIAEALQHYADDKLGRRSSELRDPAVPRNRFPLNHGAPQGRTTPLQITQGMPAARSF